MRTTKLRSRKTTVDGIVFASKLEADRYIQLREMRNAGEIFDLELQPEFQIIDGYVDPDTGEKVKSTHYVADFKYTDRLTKVTIVEDTKGVETETFKVKWKLAVKRYKQFEFRKLTRMDV